MIKPRQTSVVILITLAELAWLAAFGLLFAYRGKVGELGKAKEEVRQATNDLAMYRTNAPDMARLLDDLKAAQAEAKKRERGRSDKKRQHHQGYPVAVVHCHKRAGRNEAEIGRRAAKCIRIGEPVAGGHKQTCQRERPVFGSGCANRRVVQPNWTT